MIFLADNVAHKVGTIRRKLWVGLKLTSGGQKTDSLE